MRDVPAPSVQNRAYGRRLREALDQIEGLIVDGLRHGFFDYSVACEIGKDGRRQLVIRAGKTHKFTIPEDELPRSSKPAIPAMGTLQRQIKVRSSVIGGIPRPETRSAERRRAGREVFGETIASSKRQSDQPDAPSLAAAPRA